MKHSHLHIFLAASDKWEVSFWAKLHRKLIRWDGKRREDAHDVFQADFLGIRSVPGNDTDTVWVHHFAIPIHHRVVLKKLKTTLEEHSYGTHFEQLDKLITSQWRQHVHFKTWKLSPSLKMCRKPSDKWAEVDLWPFVVHLSCLTHPGLLVTGKNKDELPRIDKHFASSRYSRWLNGTEEAWCLHLRKMQLVKSTLARKWIVKLFSSTVNVADVR